MSDNKDISRHEESIQILLESLDALIEELNVQSVQKDSNFDPIDVFSNDFNPQGNENELITVKIEDFLLKLKEADFPGGVLQYSRISEKMFDKKYSIEVVENVSEKILIATKKNFDHILEKDATLKNRFYKLIDHIQLASFQISEIAQRSIEKQDELMKELSESRAELKKHKEEFEENINDTKQNLNRDLKKTKTDMEKELSKIYVQFVTILGIFTAIVVSVFGGLSIVSGIFNKINETSMWKIILTGSMVSIFVLCLLFLLTRWISTLVNKTFDYESERNFMQIVTNNGAFATGIFIFCYLIITAVVFSSKIATEKLKSLISVADALPILIVLMIPILVGVAVFIKTIDLRKYKKSDHLN